MSYKITEIFFSIQGEGSFAGTPVIFIRFSGCNKKCKFCDTDYFNFEEMNIREILLEIEKLNRTKTKIVVLTGGEPLLQANSDLLIALNAKYELHLETNGSIPLGPSAHFFTHITCSPKQSLEETKLEFSDDLKLVFPFEYSHEDFKNFKCANRFLQPLDNDSFNINKAINECMSKNYKLSLQLHKTLGLK